MKRAMDDLKNRCHNWRERHPIISFYLTYSLLFFVGFELCYGRFFRASRKSFIWCVDGFEISYPAFVYTGKWIRSVFINIFIRHKIVIPMWDMRLGFGSDVMAEMGSSFCAITDPFNMMSALFPAQYSQFAFDLALVLKIYMAGVTYCIYARGRGKSDEAVFAGAMAYIFSAPIFILFRQFGIHTPFILFPLVMLGVERIFEKKKERLYIISLALCIALYTYFAYMIAIFIVGYCVITVLVEIREHSMKDVGRLVVRFFVSSLIAGMTGAVIALPTIRTILSISRLNLEHDIPLYAWVREILTNFLTGYDGGSDWIIGFPVLTLISMFVILCEKEFWKEKIILVILTVSLFIPFIGHVFNGFGYATNRWVFGYVFFLSYLVTIVIDRIAEIRRSTMIVVGGLLLLYGIMLMWGFKDFDLFKTMILVFGIVVCVLVCVFMKTDMEMIRKTLLIAVAVSCLFPTYNWFAASRGNLPSVEMDKGTAYNNMMENGGKPLLNMLNTDKLTRYEACESGRSRNSSWFYGIGGMDMYNNIYIDAVDRFLKDVGTANVGVANEVSGLDRRSLLEMLLGVNYYIAKDVERLPAGFDMLLNNYSAEDGAVYTLWGRSHTADMIYAFDVVANMEEFRRCNAQEKQNLLMNAVVIEDTDDLLSSMSHFQRSGDISSECVDYKVTEQNGMKVSNDGIQVEVSGAQMTLELASDVSDAELTVLFDGLMNMSDNVHGFSVDCAAFYGDEWIAGRAVSITTPVNHMCKGQDAWLVNLGMIYRKVNKIVLTFDQVGRYTLNELKVYGEGKDQIMQMMNGLKHCSDEIAFADNKISADVNLKDESMVFIAVPYEAGWKAMVDASPAKIYKADEAFMAIRVDKGRHQIELKYKTPLIELSVFTGIGFGIYMIYSIWQFIIAQVVHKEH